MPASPSTCGRSYSSKSRLTRGSSMTTCFGMRSCFSIEAFVVAFVVLINEAEPFLSPAAGGIPLMSARHQNCDEDCTRQISARTNAPKVFMDIQRMGEQAHRQTALTLVESTIFRRSCASRNSGGSDAVAAAPTRWLLDDGDHGGRGGGGRGGRDDHGGGEGDGDAWDKEGPRPLLSATGLMSGLNELWDALRNFRFPGNHKGKGGKRQSESDAEYRERWEEKLSEVLVEDIVLQESVIPRDILLSAAVESGLLGQEASTDRIRACADILNQWYQDEGYLLSSVSNAIIAPNGTVSITVIEPVVSSSEPVKLTFYKSENASDPSSDLIRVERGKTKPRTIARGLGLKGGKHFRVDAKRWRGILASGLFNGAQLSGAHQTPGESGATLDVNLEERRTVVFEPGVTKALFGANWAGEVCFEERNVLGLNSVLGLDVRRTMASPFTSLSLRLGSNRFGQPGAWQVSFFRDAAVAPSEGYHTSGSAIGTASSAPVFSTASPNGTPRDLGILARSLRGAHLGRTDRVRRDRDSTVVPTTEDGEGEGDDDHGKGNARGRNSTSDAEASVCRGVSLSTSWPFSSLQASLGAGYQQVGIGASSTSGASDVVTLSGGLSKHWSLPGVLLRRRTGVGREKEASAEGGDVVDDGAGGARVKGKTRGSVSSFLDVKTGCMLAPGTTPQPFTQEVATLVQRVPVGPHGRAGSWNVTINAKQQLQHSSDDTPRHQVPPFGGQRTVRGFAEGELGRVNEYALGTAEVRIPFRNFLGRFSAEGVVFTDLGAFRSPPTWSGESATITLTRGRRREWDTAGAAPRGGWAADEVGPSLEDVRTEEASSTIGDVVSCDGDDGIVASPASEEGDASAGGGGALERVTGGLSLRRGQGLGLRIGDTIQIDVGISRDGIKQVHIGLVDRNF